MSYLDGKAHAGHGGRVRSPVITAADRFHPSFLSLLLYLLLSHFSFLDSLPYLLACYLTPVTVHRAS